MNFDEYVARIKAGEDLERRAAETFLGLMLDDETMPDATIADVLTALTKKTVTVDEICGFVDAMRVRMVRLPYRGEAIDTCGTGGDRKGTFNISTAAAILLAAGGVTVAKHGNRAATSKSGSADVLEALGIPVDLKPDVAAATLAQRKFVFLFAPQYHPALKKLVMVRKQLGFPTVFNLLGPLLNPAGVRRQVIGTFSLASAKLLAAAMSRMQYEHALVITSEDGLDEASLSAPVNVFEIKGARVKEYQLNAADYGLPAAPIAELQGKDADTSAQIIIEAVKPADQLSAPQRMIVLNAGLGFYVSGQVPSVEEGVKQATATLQSGQAARKLQELARP